MQEDVKSPARRLISLVGDSMALEVRRSNERYNHTMNQAIATALQGGLKWTSDDINLYMPGAWCFGMCPGAEAYYAMAIKAGNLSFCHAFEYARNRKPFIFNGKRIGVGAYGPGRINGGAERFSWQSNIVQVVCTSFAKDSSYMTATNVWDTNHRFRITREQLKAVEKGELVIHPKPVRLKELAIALQRALDHQRYDWRHDSVPWSVVPGDLGSGVFTLNLVNLNERYTEESLQLSQMGSGDITTINVAESPCEATLDGWKRVIQVLMDRCPAQARQVIGEIRRAEERDWRRKSGSKIPAE